MLIEPQNIPGRHCASSGLRNLASFHGLGWSEALCFGLGAGLGIWFVKSKNPSRMIHVRSFDLEERFFIQIGQPLSWDRFENASQSEKALIDTLNAGLPAIIQTDICYLPYYNTTTHFPGHVITVWGYDADKQVFFITDTEREDLIEVGFKNIGRARFCGDGFFDVKGNCMAPKKMSPAPDMPRAVAQAILCASKMIMDKAWEFQGILGLENCLKEMDKWKDFKDWQWTARFSYQVLEKRGTGGGGFRLMYADFLDEAGAFLPQVFSLGLPEMMRKTASAWTGLANAFKKASEKDSPDFTNPGKCLEAVIKIETAYHQAALEIKEPL